MSKRGWKLCSVARASSTTLHFFGNGKGESIALETPLGWGVVDCFSYQSVVPVLDFLIARGVQELRFLALTHPHEDHFSGMDRLVSYFLANNGIREFWRFPALDSKRLFPLLKARSESTPEPFRSLHLQSLDSLQRAYQQLVEPMKAGSTELKTPTLGSRLLQVDAERFFMDTVSPPGAMIVEAEQALADHVAADQHQTSAKRWDLNRLSIAIRVRHSGGEAVLGADTPGVSWKHCFSSSSWTSCAARILKSPHHGSDKDNQAEVLRELSPAGKGLAVVTRYSPSRLPRPESIIKMKKEFERVIVLGKTVSQNREGGVVRKRREYTLERLDVPLDVHDLNSLAPVQIA